MFLSKHFLGRRDLTVLDDVRENLQRIFSTRRGAGYFLDNFGVSDIGFRTPEELLLTLSAEIRENIRLYEPRVELTNIDEDWDEDGKRSKLVVLLRLRDHNDKLRVVVDLRGKTFDVEAVKKPPVR
jgi:phage baseplate assembly protein W